MRNESQEKKLDDELLQSIRTMADDADWEVREDAAGAIKRLNDKHFNTYLPVWRVWINDPNPNIRRAVEVGLLRIPKVHYHEAFELLMPLLFDEDTYVRKNCGPFALSAVAYRNPEHAFKRFGELLESENKNLRWNIAACLGVMFGMRYPEHSIPLLAKLAKDKRRFVWRAAASSLIKLLRKYPEYKQEVYSWKDLDHVSDVVRQYVKE
jgi:HEAT repeat protein